MKEFILEESKLKNEALSKTILSMQDKIDSDSTEIENLEKLIKSQVQRDSYSHMLPGSTNQNLRKLSLRHFSH